MQQPYRPRQRHLAAASTIISPRTPRRSGRRRAPQTPAIDHEVGVGRRLRPSTPKRIATPCRFSRSAKRRRAPARIEMRLLAKNSARRKRPARSGSSARDARLVEPFVVRRCARAKRGSSVASRGSATTRLPLRIVRDGGAPTSRSPARPVVSTASSASPARTTAPACRRPSTSRRRARAHGRARSPRPRSRARRARAPWRGPRRPLRQQ